MASSSARPHRQARSTVSYRDPFYDYEGDLAFCRRSRSSSSRAIAKSGKDSQHQTKTNLILNPAKNRANAKERAEAVQLQRAINESLSREKSSKTSCVCLQRAVHESLPGYSMMNVASSEFNHEKGVVESMDEHALKALPGDEIILMKCVDETAFNDCLAFQCLLDVATEAVLENTSHAGGSKDIKLTHFMKKSQNNQNLEPSLGLLQVQMPQNGEMVNKTTRNEMDEQLGKCEDYSQHKEKDQTNVHNDGNSDAFSDWGEGNGEQVDTENESSDLSDESGCQIRSPERLRQNAPKKSVKDNVFPVQVKKARSARPSLKLKALSSESYQTLVSTPCKLLVKASGGKENISSSTSMEALNKKEQIAAEIGAANESNQNVKNAKSWKMQISGGLQAEQQGVWSIPLQPSALLHRRVIGLSRRHRPPPLHPYLVNRDW